MLNYSILDVYIKKIEKKRKKRKIPHRLHETDASEVHIISEESSEFHSLLASILYRRVTYSDVKI